MHQAARRQCLTLEAASETGAVTEVARFLSPVSLVTGAPVFAGAASPLEGEAAAAVSLFCTPSSFATSSTVSASFACMLKASEHSFKSKAKVIWHQM